MPGKEIFYVSPLVFRTARIKRKRKIETVYEIENVSEELFSNIILKEALSKSYDIEFPEIVDDKEDFFNSLEKTLTTRNENIRRKIEFDEAQDWEIIEIEKLGNFNYKKSSLAKDFDSIAESPSKSVREVFGAPVSVEPAQTVNPVVDMDDSQAEALSHALANNVVIQGPPGTGKSQSIVNLISNFLSLKKKVLFVSQKRSALDVVYNRLVDLDLKPYLAYFNSDQDEKKVFYSTLKDAFSNLTSFETKFEDLEIKEENELLNFYLTNYAVDDSESSSYNLVEMLINSGFKKEELNFKGTAPSFSIWLNVLEDLREIDQKAIRVFGKRPLGQQPFIELNKILISEKDPILKLEKRISDFKKSLTQIKECISRNNLDSSLEGLTKLALAASIMSMVNKSQLSILIADSKEFKSFRNWAKKFELAKVRYERQLKLNKKWVNKPLKSEITELIDLVKHQHAPRGIFGMLRRRSGRIDRAFEGFDLNLSQTGKLQLLEELRIEWNLQAELDEIEIKLKHNFEINNPESELAVIFQVRSKLNEIQQSDYLHILEHENSIQIIEDLSSIHSLIQSYKHLLKFTFDSVDEDNIAKHDERILFLEDHLSSFKLIINELKSFFKIEREVLEYIKANKNQDINKLTANVLYSELLKNNKFVTQFDELEGEALRKALLKSEDRSKKMMEKERQNIVQNIRSEFNSIEKILEIPSAKLKAKGKDQKKILKVQKRILIHEIGKKQQHLSIKSFTENSWEYLSSFQKVWIMNPLAVSQRLGLNKEMFDVVIFDEASQIPFEDSLPAIQRANKVVVVGDEMQMPPSQFFSSGTDQFTILDQANLAFPKMMFKWHYRSVHPDLIKFSNRKFYEDNLLTFPSITKASPISFHKVNGVFDKGSNLLEAKEIAQLLKSKKDVSKIAIIAFSKEQENQIRKEIIKVGLSSDGLLIRNLENVQGIERDEVIISVGYAKNKEGRFVMNFGPVNQASGSNRLNVMFTRAKEKMTVFSSVQSSDFGLSDNAGVNCLKDFIHYCESQDSTACSQKRTELIFDFLNFDELGLTYAETNYGDSMTAIVQYETKKILLLDPVAGESSSKDLKTLHNVLSNRFNDLKIVLSIDRWNNPERFENEIISFFS